MAETYIVQFKAGEELTKTQEKSPSQDKQEMSSKEPKTNEEIANKQKDFNKKAFAKFMTVYGVTQTATAIYNRVDTAQSLARGDNLSAVMKSEQNAVRDKFIGTALNIVGGAVVAGVVGAGFVAGMELLGYVKESINLGIQNQSRLNQLEAQKHVMANEQERFVRNSTTERIRTW